MTVEREGERVLFYASETRVWACRSVYGAQASGPFYLVIVQLIIQGHSSVRSIGYYKNLWEDKLCPFFNHSLFLPVPCLFLKKKRPDPTPYRPLNSPVAGAHSENFLIPSEVSKTSSGDSYLPNLDVVLSLCGRAFGQLKVSAYGHIHIVNLPPHVQTFHDNPQSGRAQIWLQ